jgi:hypothetical protein
VFVQDVPRDSAIEVRFEPLGPLADGSTGKTIVRVVKDMMIEDIPVGAYRATARIQEPNGRKRAAQLSRKSFTANVGPDAIVEWESKDSCIGNFGNGLDRIYLYVQ